MKVLMVPIWIGKLFNRLPLNWKRTGQYSYYFASGRFSALNYKSFRGWYFADTEELWKLIKYQAGVLRR
jgi:hypothetical protein